MGNRQGNTGNFSKGDDNLLYLGFPLTEDGVMKINTLRKEIQKWVKADMEPFPPLKTAVATVFVARTKLTLQGAIALDLIRVNHVPVDGFDITLEEIAQAPPGFVVLPFRLEEPVSLVAELQKWSIDKPAVDPTYPIKTLYGDIDIFTVEEVEALFEVSTEANYGHTLTDFIAESLVPHMRQLQINPAYGLNPHSHVKGTDIKYFNKKDLIYLG